MTMRLRKAEMDRHGLAEDLGIDSSFEGWTEFQ